MPLTSLWECARQLSRTMGGRHCALEDLCVTLLTREEASDRTGMGNVSIRASTVTLFRPGPESSSCDTLGLGGLAATPAWPCWCHHHLWVLLETELWADVAGRSVDTTCAQAGTHLEMGFTHSLRALGLSLMLLGL